MQAAVDESLKSMKDRVNGFGGIIAVGAKSEIGIGFTTKQMPWAYITTTDNDVDLIKSQIFNKQNVTVKIHSGSKPNEHSVHNE